MMRKALTYAIGWAPQQLADIMESQLGTAMMGLFMLSNSGSQLDWQLQLRRIQDIHDVLNGLAPTLKANNPALQWVIDINLKVIGKILEVMQVMQFFKPTLAEEDEYPTLPSNPDDWFKGPVG